MNTNNHASNPEWEGMPLGLGMKLAQDPQASEHFWRMSLHERARIVAYVQDSATGGEAQERIAETVDKLRDGQWV